MHFGKITFDVDERGEVGLHLRHTPAQRALARVGVLAANALAFVVGDNHSTPTFASVMRRMIF